MGAHTAHGNIVLLWSFEGCLLFLDVTYCLHTHNTRYYMIVNGKCSYSQVVTRAARVFSSGQETLNSASKLDLTIITITHAPRHVHYGGGLDRSILDCRIQLLGAIPDSKYSYNTPVTPTGWRKTTLHPTLLYC
ncbi:hypothetical protein DFP73DRAFT_570036, partial [Morchella snyderi]